jgi:diguanylate cyclase (GGDEF)-like protein
MKPRRLLSLPTLMALTHLPMLVFTAGILVATAVIFTRLPVEVLLLERTHDTAGEALQALATRARLVWVVSLTGFVVFLGLATSLTLWIQRHLHTRLAILLDYCEATLDGDRIEEPPVDGTDILARIDQRLHRLSAEIESQREVMRTDLAMQLFHTRLAKAMNLADDERAALDLAGRALSRIAPDHPGEVLLADSSQAHLRRVVSVGGGAGCPVSCPGQCHAVKQGSVMHYEDPDAIDACPHLMGRGVPAICAPISVMGRAVGVLHLVGSPGECLDEDTDETMVRITTQLGNRIGMLRALQTSQLQADTDPLTGLLNRRSLESRSIDMLRDDLPVAVALCDLDRFKLLNDTHGHAAGDRALRLFATTVRRTLPESMLVSRFGGEEFVVVMPMTEQSRAVSWLESVRTALKAAITEAGVVAFTCSFGIAGTWSGATDLAALLEEADEALYRAKEEGRDRIVCAGGGAIQMATG